MREVAVIGAGSTVFGKLPAESIEELGRKAVQAAIKHAGIKPKEINFCHCATCFGGMVIGQRILKHVGVTGIEIVNVENACAGGATAFRGVWLGVASGLYDMGIAIGVESMTTSPIAGKLILPAEGDLEGVLGNSTVAHWALRMRRHMEKYGTTLEQFAKVSVKNHHNGCLNPFSQYKKELTVEEVLSSRMICDPITLLQCCPNTDGAAALILCSLEVAKRYTTEPIKIAASVLKGGDYIFRQKEMAISDMTMCCAREAYEMAGCGPEDVDLVELHDPFTYNEIAHCEELGLCAEGEGGRLIDDGVTQITGRNPVNPSGGLLSRGHPLSATGVEQIAELVWHLRREARDRQVKDAKVGLAHTMGGQVAGLEGGAVCIHILKR